MNFYNNPMWRKGLILSATFLLLTVVSVGCKKKRPTVGSDLISQNDLLNSAGVDTFSLITYTIREDSTIVRNTSGNPTRMLLGTYNDPVFGKVRTDIYTQLQLSELNPPLDDPGIVVDSMVFSLEYAGLYGSTGNQSFAIYRITEDLFDDSVYYAFDTLNYDATNLIESGSEIQNLNQYNEHYVGDDTLYNQLRIRLNTSLGDDLLAGFSNFSSNEDFVNFFKGILIRPTTNPAINEGGIGYFDVSDVDSKITMYYTLNSEQKEFDFKINSDCVRFNHYSVDTVGTSVSAVVNDHNLGQQQFYAQSFNARAVVEIPGLSNIPKSAIIHKATLELPVQYQSGHKFGLGDLIRTTTRIDETDDLYDIFVIGDYDDATKQFTFNLRDYVQSVVTGENPNYGIYLSPFFFVSSADRIIFNGSSTINKAKPKLSIIYTEF